MTLANRIARLEGDTGTPTCGCPADDPLLREAAEQRFVDVVVRRRPAGGQLVCPRCGRVRSSRCPTDTDVEATFRKLREQLAEAERACGVVPGPRESIAERLRRLLLASEETTEWHTDTAWKTS